MKVIGHLGLLGSSLYRDTSRGPGWGTGSRASRTCETQLHSAPRARDEALSFRRAGARAAAELNLLDPRAAAMAVAARPN